MTEKVRIRGLFRIAGWMFLLWGSLITCKGFRDAFLGEPEANLFSAQRWEFVSRGQWLTWSGFEIAYGLACTGLAVLLWAYARRLPEYRERLQQQ